MENFTTYTEVDDHNEIEFTSSKVDFVMYDGVHINRMHKDFGAGHFSGDLEHQVEVQYTDDGSQWQYGYPGWVTAWMLSTENSGRIQDIIDGSESAVGIAFYKYPNSHIEALHLFEVYGGSIYYSSPRVGTTYPDAPKYSRISRVGNTLTWTIYTNGSYDTVLTTRTLTLHGTPSYRYVNIGGGRSAATYICYITGFTRYLVLSLATSTVTTQDVTDIRGATAIGNGNITGLGVPNPTAHGVCWNTVGTPTISDDKSDEGAASETGAFTTDMVDLIPLTKYYVRAYVTNPIGTTYGGEVEFTTLPAAYSQAHIIG